MSLAADATSRTEALFEHAAADAPGCAVGVVADGEVVFAKGYGLASLEHGVGITPATRFYMASVSKQVTALAVLLAAEAGQLGLDDPIRKTIPELPAHMEGATVSRLLAHTAGVRDYFSVGLLAGLTAEHVYTDAEVLQILERQRALDFAPGDDFVYSNSGYVLLAIAIERAAGKRLDDFAREAIFAPLGMDGARFQHDHAAVVPDKAFGYERHDGAWRVANCVLDVVGDGGMYASLSDMLAWTKNLLAPRIGASAIDAMQQPAALRSGASTGYGFGLGVGTHRGLRILTHGGGNAGYRTHLLAYPTEGLGVVVLSNDASAWPGSLALQVAEAHLGDRMAPAPSWPPPPPEAAIAARAGTYRAGPGEVLTLFARDGGLCAVGLPQPLRALGPGSFVLGDPDVARFDFDASGGGFVLTQSSAPTRRYLRCEPPQAIDADAFLGDFWSDEAGARCSIVGADDGLAVSFAHGPPIALQPIASDCLFVEGFGATLTFQPGRSGGAAGFTLDSGRARGIAYDRVSQRVSARAR